MLVLASIGREVRFLSRLLIDPGKDMLPFAFKSAVVMQPNEVMMSWSGVAKKRRWQQVAAKTVKCSRTVARTQQSWREGNDRRPLPGEHAHRM